MVTELVWPKMVYTAPFATADTSTYAETLIPAMTGMSYQLST